MCCQCSWKNCPQRVDNESASVWNHHLAQGANIYLQCALQSCHKVCADFMLTFTLCWGQLFWRNWLMKGRNLPNSAAKIESMIHTYKGNCCGLFERIQVSRIECQVNDFKFCPSKDLVSVGSLKIVLVLGGLEFLLYFIIFQASGVLTRPCCPFVLLWDILLSSILSLSKDLLC